MTMQFDFSEYGRSLTQSLFADRILLALARYERIGQVDEEAQQSLHDAKDFFLRIIEAERVFDTPSAPQSSMANARIFGEAINSTTIPLVTKIDFIHYVENMQRTVDDIISGSAPGEAKINSLEEFFSNYSALHSGRSWTALETSVII